MGRWEGGKVGRREGGKRDRRREEGDFFTFLIFVFLSYINNCFKI